MDKATEHRPIRLYAIGSALCKGGWLGEALGAEFEVTCCGSREALMGCLAEAMPDAVAMDAAHAAGKGSLLGELQGRHYRMPVVVILDEPHVETVVRCVKAGAYDVVDRVEVARRLPSILRKAADDHRMLVEVDQLEEAYQRRGKFGARLVGVSAALQEVYDRVSKVARTDASVLLSGESGTGKELVAHTIHELSPRKETGRIICVDCAAIPKDLLESELFGHEKGAFTGADRRRIGRCEQAHMGTLFLDEICEMDVGLQSKLLRFLEERNFTRVGGSEHIQVDTRVIAATNRDPIEQIRAGRLREDLYYRLNVVPIHIPPLRERPEDIPVLAQHFLEFYGEKHNKYFWDFSPDAMRMLLCYGWPGNVRDLRNTIERIVVLATADTISADLLPEHIRECLESAEPPRLAVEEALETVHTALRPPAQPAQEPQDVLPLEEVERKAILEAVRKYPGNVSRAARKLGLSRATMYRKLARYGIK